MTRSGWEEEAEEEDIDSYVAHTVNVEGPREYREIYREARVRIAGGETEERIRNELDTRPTKHQPSQQALSLLARRAQAKSARIQDGIQERLSRIRKEALADAFAGRPPKYNRDSGVT
jgi:hypothetical protein